MKHNAIVVDLDGTLCNTNHRHDLVVAKKWDEFHAGCTQDAPNDWCKRLVDSLSPSCKIIFITGRPKKYEPHTRKWLSDIGIKDYTLYMKPDGDFRKDFEFKLEIYETYIQYLYDVVFAIDDRKDTAKMWRSKGVVCLHCAEGDF